VKNRLMSGIPAQAKQLELAKYVTTATTKEEVMKRLLAVIALTSCLAVPSFAGDVVGHTAKVAGKDSAKVVTTTAKDTAKAGVKVVRFLF
jgi:phage-related minor tail protein